MKLSRILIKIKDDGMHLKSILFHETESQFIYSSKS